MTVYNEAVLQYMLFFYVEFIESFTKTPALTI